MSKYRNQVSILNIPNKYSILPKFIFEAMLRGTANAKINDGENSTDFALESQKKKYPCPPTID